MPNPTQNTTKLKIAIIGSRGYPYVYSGYETLVKNIGERFVAKGMEVTVYCHAYLFDEQPKQVNGIQLKYFPTIKSKSLSQPIHSFIAFWHVAFSKADVVLVLNVSNGPFGFITRLFGKPTMINVDGLEWLRPKWKGFGARYFKWSAKMAKKWMDLLVTDADSMQEIYQQEFGASSVVIAYGADSNKGAAENLLHTWQLQANDYYLIVGRMIPDNNSDLIIEGFIQSNSTKKLVIVGDVPYADAYADKIKSYKDPRLVFTGYVNNSDCLATLYKYCYAYMHGHEFGGTNPTLLKAMANGCAISAIDTVFSREVLQDEKYGFYFKKNTASLTAWFNWAAENNLALEEKRNTVINGINDKYDWDSVTDLYLYHLNALANKKRAE
jgi:glycosyltransferase involved in cell wall biosynthesis